MTPAARSTALGFSVHTGWAMAVAVSGPLSSPALIHRARIELKPGAESVGVFHVAAEQNAAGASRHVERCAKLVAAEARVALKSLLTAITPKSPSALGVVTSNASLPSALDAILRSHMQIHSAEGDFYRRALLQAGEAMRLKSIAVRSRELASAGAKVLATPENKLPDWLTSFGRKVGRPWGRDEKDAFLAACIALASL